ncbi:M61 family metallopeptidase [Hanstruepera flava]|uniref:M61 family metallopeptidase n=1 Tax=Hanstruepera flava TaxID=2930218 RepID=UPI0020286FCF|nr:hypothetical protein [Hanstruepera flava]
MFLNQLTRLHIVSLFIALMLFSIKSNAETIDSKQATTYTITIHKSNPKLAQIEARFTLKDSLLYMGWGASNLSNRWATFVHNLEVMDKQEQLLSVQALDDAQWKINAPIHTEIRLRYDVHLDHENYDWSSGIDAVAYTTDLGVFYTGRTLFVLNGEDRTNISVSFNIPKDWAVTNPWSESAENAKSFMATNITDLVTALIFAGNHKEISLKRDDFELVFALGSTDIMNQETELKELAQGVLDYYIELMGGIPNPSPDNPLHKSVVVISSSEKTDGEALGNNVSVLIEKNGDDLSKTFSRFIFAHEFFHLWCGKSFSPASDDSEWFKEGFTNYYTLKALRHVNFLTDESYLDFLSSFFYKRYHNDEGVGRYAMADGEKKHDHWGLVYAGGMLVGMSQDLIIRNATNNEKSIDDLMRQLFEKYGGSNNTYTLQELQELYGELSGTIPTEFFNMYILGTNKIPIDEYLTLAGLDAKIENGQLIISKTDVTTPKQQNVLDGFFGELNTK